jgi:hypothetical protein
MEKKRGRLKPPTMAADSVSMFRVFMGCSSVLFSLVVLAFFDFWVIENLFVAIHSCTTGEPARGYGEGWDNRGWPICYGGQATNVTDRFLAGV